MAVKKRVVFVCGGVALLLFASAVFATLRRHRSKFEFLYALRPQIKACKPGPASPGLMRSLVFMTRRTSVSSGSTLFVFPPEENARLGQELNRHFGMPAKQDWTARSFGALVRPDYSLTIATGSAAEEVATIEGLTCKAGGSVIIVSEPPDWFAARLQSILRFLHLA